MWLLLLSDMDYKILLLNLLCQMCVVTSVIKFIREDSENNALETCVVDIISSKKLHKTDVIVIKDDLLMDHVFRNLHESYNVILYVKDITDSNVSMNVSPGAYTYIVSGDHRDNLKRIIDKLNRDWYRQPHALYIITLTNIGGDKLPAIFELLLKYHIIHVMIIVEEDGGAAIYSYLPYAPGHCGRNPYNTLALGKCKNVKDLDIVEILHDADKPDLTNCTLNALAHNFPPLVISDLEPSNKLAIGIERFLLELLLETEKISINFTFLPETVVIGGISDNLTVTGVMLDLFKNRVDLLFGGYSLNYRRGVLFDILYIHLVFEDIFSIITRRADLEERWKIVFVMFQYKVWLLLLFTMLICSILLSNNIKRFTIRHNGSSEMLKLFGNATQNVRLKLREKLFENCIIIHWLWFTFLVSCYYQTRLTSYSIFRSYKPQINDYMSLANYNLTPCFPESMAAFLVNSDIAPIINKEYLDTESCQTYDLALDEVAKSTSKYTVAPYYQYMWWAARHVREQHRLYVMPENIYQTHYTMFLKRGFPLMHKFQVTMSHIFESGFVDVVKRTHQIPNDPRYTGSTAGAFEVCVLTLSDLIIPFSILIAGHIFGLIIFVIEFSTKSKTSKKHK